MKTMAKDDNKAKKSLDDFLSFNKSLETIGINEQRKDHPANDVSDKYDSARRNFAEETVRKYYPNVNPENLNEQDIDNYVGQGARNIRNLAAQSIKTNPEEILKLIDSKKLSENLENSLGNEEIANAILNLASEDDRKILGKYQAYSGLSNLVRQYKKLGDDNTPAELKERVYALASKGIQEAAEKRLLDMGLSKRNAKIGAQLESLALREGKYDNTKILEYVETGLKAEYKKLTEEIPADKYNEVVRNTLTKLIKSEKTAEYDLGAQIIYNAGKQEKSP